MGCGFVDVDRWVDRAGLPGVGSAWTREGVWSDGFWVACMQQEARWLPGHAHALPCIGKTMHAPPLVWGACGLGRCPQTGPHCSLQCRCSLPVAPIPPIIPPPLPLPRARLLFLSFGVQLEGEKAKLQVVTGMHVYSVQPGVPKVGGTRLGV